MKPGRPPLADKVQALEHQLGIALQKIAHLETRVREMQEAFNRGTIPAPKAEYVPQFTSWAQTRGG